MQDIDQALDLLTARAEQLSVTLTLEQMALIKLFCLHLAEYNSHTNLVSDATPGVLAIDHVLDSLTLVKFIDEFKRRKRANSDSVRLIDIGSGAGLPGLILAIALPYLKVTLLDSVNKKVRFLSSFVKAAGLDNRVRTICDRAEELAHHRQYREKFEVATARAVGTFDIVAELAMPLLEVEGELYVQKSLGQLEDASRDAARALPKLGGAILDATVLDSRILGKERVIVVSEKLTKTGNMYPRTWAQMKSHPLSS